MLKTNKHLTFNPPYSRKTAILGPVFTELENFRPKTALQWWCSM